MEDNRTTWGTMSSRTLISFFAISFVIGWGIIALLMLFPRQLEKVFGPMGYTNPLFILAVYSPAIAGIGLVWRHHRFRGLAGFFHRLTLCRMPALWWVFLAVGLPAVFYLGSAIRGTITEPFPFYPWYRLFPALVIGLVIGPVEEFGWRGVALPLLQRRFAPLWAGLILGVVWGLWHLPAFFLNGSPQSAWPFAPYFLGVIAISVILTPMFNAARGSILIPALYHFQMNGPAWPDAQPWDSYVFALVAVVIVVLNRKTMFTRDGAVTEIAMPRREHHRRLSGSISYFGERSFDRIGG